MASNNSKPLIRTFIAIELPSTIKAELSALMEKAPHIRWRIIDKLHITVVFLSDLTPPQIKEVVKITKKTVKNLRSISFKLADVHIQNKSMLWIKVEDTDGQLAAIYQNLTAQLKDARIGGPYRNIYNPHITLAKTKNEQAILEQDEVFARARQIFSATPLTVDHFTLYASAFDKEINTTKYTKLTEIKFGQVKPERKTTRDLNNEQYGLE